jgi:hypothetical protein
MDLDAPIVDGAPDSMLDDVELDEDLLAALDDTVPSPGAVVSMPSDDAGDYDEELGAMRGPAAVISQVLEQYQTKVVLSVEEIDSKFEEARRHIEAVNELYERLDPLLRPDAPHAEREAAQTRLRAAQIQWHETALEHHLMIKRCHARMAVLVNNEIQGHSSRNPQTAPFRVLEAIQAVDIGYLCDNPAVTTRLRRVAPYVQTLRPTLF